jgi:hypothetical protein
MGAGASLTVRLDDDHDVERLGKQLVQGRELVDLGANAFRGRGLLAILDGQRTVLDAFAVLFVRAAAAVSPSIPQV